MQPSHQPHLLGQQISPSHLVSVNSYSPVQQSPQQIYQPGLINYIPQQQQQHHHHNNFVYPVQYNGVPPQILTHKLNHKLNHVKQMQANTHNLSHTSSSTASKSNHLHKVKAANSQHGNNTKQPAATTNRLNESATTVTVAAAAAPINIKNENEWPTLNANSKAVTKPKNASKKSSVQEENDDTPSPEEDLLTLDLELKTTPYLTDKNQLQKLIKNVNFIKTTIEQHYLTENNLKQQTTNQLSFKDAVLTKKQPANKLQEKSVPAPLSTAAAATTSSKSDTATASANKVDPLAVTTSSTKPKRRSRRSRSKKNRSADDTNKSVNRDSYSVESKVDFNLENEEFPDLISNPDVNKTSVPKLNLNATTHEDATASRGINRLDLVCLLFN